MAISITCPGCQSVYPVPETLAGKTIRCKKCGEMVAVTAPAAPAVARAVARPVAAKPAARVVDDDDDAPPARARRDRDDEDAPRKPEKKGSKLPLVLGAVLGGLVIGAAGVGALFAAGLFGDSKPNDVAETTRPTVTPSVTNPGGRDDEEKPTTSAKADTRKPPKTDGDGPLVVGPAPSITPPPMATTGPMTSGRTIPDNINAIALKKCKDATVFFDVESRPGRRATGSGWVGLEKNLIFTNSHVVGMKSPGSKKPVKMTAYLYSGTPRQKEIPHSRLEILAVDREADLAVIRVLNEPDMPPPLEVRPSAELTELEKAVILGFPGGYTLAEITNSSKQPSVTVNATNVGAVRRNNFGNLSGVQFNGGSAPGGSGGPIVDMNGDVIAVLYMGPRDAVLASAACYGVPTEYVTGLIAGRVAEVEYGQPFRKGGKVHIPVTAHCLDPFERLKSVGVASWVGETNGRTRPPGAERTGQEQSDANYQEVALTYKHGKDDSVAAGELVLPPLPTGRSYWAQPYYANARVARQWQAGNKIELTGAPVDLEPADLSVRYRPGAKRTLKLANKSSLVEFQEGEGADKSERLQVETKMEMTETVQRPWQGESAAVATLLLNYDSLHLNAQLGLKSQDDILPKEFRNLLDMGIKKVQGAGHVNKYGEIYKTASDVRGVGQFAQLFKVFSDDALESLMSTSIYLPNTRVEPNFKWTNSKSHRLLAAFADGSEMFGPEPKEGSGRGRQAPKTRTRSYRYQQDVTYTYLGTRMRGGVKEAVIKIEGKIVTAPGTKAENGARGLLKGHAYIDLDTGTVLEAEVEKELEIDTSAGGVKKRISGINTYKLSRGSAVTN
ncbi:MAG TPA: trypsin-like peptidase domain-containing protein [Fimbriiglobus sp.]|nr:trypsin-like peptidase domain-containing protein [Fimbriiglobus sp.]